jgi:nickel superoxide dismutase
MLNNLISKFNNSLESVSAHCDIPCGIYDARTVMYHAVSTLRQIDILLSLEEKQAELVKHEVRIIWGDFMKGAHLEKHPGVHALAHNIMIAGSACKQDLHREDGIKLVELCNQFSEIFWDMKGVKVKRASTPYAPNIEVVIPDL